MKTMRKQNTSRYCRASSRLWQALYAFALTFAVIINSPMATAQDPGGDLPFVSGSTGADGALTFPANVPPLQGSAMAYDAERGELVMFGGYHRQNNVPMNNTWTFDGTEWVEQTPTTVPTARYYHEMVYDSVNKVVVLFGGISAASVKLADTWIWDGTDWTLQSPTSSPPGRYNFGMAYDAARSQVLVYGGYSEDTPADSDTWVWDGSDWTELLPATSPPGTRLHALGYDPANQEVLLYGGAGTATQTWIWNGTDWTKQSPSSNPPSRSYSTIEYDPVRGGLVLFGGSGPVNYNDSWLWDGSDWAELDLGIKPEVRYYHKAAYEPTLGGIVIANGVIPTGTHRTDTWILGSTATDWQFLTGDEFSFDMRGNSTGVWNFTSIIIPSDQTVTFIKNASNTPVVWLATETVQIDGTIDLSGEAAIVSNIPGNEAQGGPGAYSGGMGGTRFDVSGSYAGAPGQGPGGGLPGTTISAVGANAVHNSVYGSASLNPPTGGSGGGGGASSATANGGNGGAGGGAIVIASSKNINVNGSILANGGTRAHGGATYGGYGSGGAIRLLADRITGSGNLHAKNGAGTTTAPRSGYIRLEAFYRTLIDNATTIYPIATAGAPTDDPTDIVSEDQSKLTITTMAGLSVPTPPAGSSAAPDVVFQDSGAITILVTAENIPNGTPITLRIVSNGEIINLPGPGNPVVALVAGTATFTVFVPSGLGSVQAFAEYVPL